MTSIMKTINIIYQPGYGGHFLKYLFSLDSTTSPQGEADSNNRLTNYNFNNALKFKNWYEYHISHSYDAVVRDYPVTVTCEHPKEFVNNSNSVNYIVDLSYADFSSYWLVSTKQRWNYFPSLRVGEFEQEQQIRKEFNFQSISMDAFLDPNQWDIEYRRVSKSMGIPVQIDQARELYWSWYNLRVRPLKEDFNQLAKQQHSEYQRKRLQHQLYGNLTDQAWTIFYDGIRGADWPDCSSQDLIDTLPNNIQTELFTKYLKQ